jgi:hypothetical protein
LNEEMSVFLELPGMLSPTEVADAMALFRAELEPQGVSVADSGLRRELRPSRHLWTSSSASRTIRQCRPQ